MDQSTAREGGQHNNAGCHCNCCSPTPMLIDFSEPKEVAVARTSEGRTLEDFEELFVDKGEGEP